MLDGTIQDYEVNVNGYEVIRKDRNRKGLIPRRAKCEKFRAKRLMHAQHDFGMFLCEIFHFAG
jgi:hypothetical protein